MKTRVDQDRMKRLAGGPFDGGEVPGKWASILLSGEPVPEGQVARYRFSARAGGYVFKGLETIVVQILDWKGMQ